MYYTSTLYCTCMLLSIQILKYMLLPKKKKKKERKKKENKKKINKVVLFLQLPVRKWAKGLKVQTTYRISVLIG